MRNRNSKPPRTGADHLLMAANVAVNGGMQYSDAFRDMLFSAVVGAPNEGPLLAEVIAAAPLRVHEAAPAAIINSAVTVALDRGDVEGAREASILGVALLAKWPEYLIAVGQHPNLVPRSDPAT